MAYYLQMDGVDDKLNIGGTKPGSLTEFEIDLKIAVREDWHQIVNFGGTNKIINFSSNTTNIAYGSDYQTVYVDGVQVTSGTPFLTVGQRHVLRGVFKAGVNTGTTGPSFFSNDVSQWLSGSIYSLKTYQSGVLVGHYDMSTQTVLDQTGNGNHATLTGGTWVDDGTTGTDVSYPYAIKQVIYADLTSSTQLKQSMYSNTQEYFSTLQKIYDNRIQQLLTSQSIYANRNVDLAMKQIVSATQINIFTTKQSLYSLRSLQYAVREIISKETQNYFNTKQQQYNNQSAVLATRQIVYANIPLTVPLKQIYIVITLFRFSALRELKTELIASREINVILRGEI